MANALYLTVYAADDPNGTSLGTVDEASELTYTHVLHGAGSGRVKIPRAHAQAALLVQDRYCRVHSDAGVMGGFWLEEATVDLSSTDEQGGEFIEWSGRGAMAYLDRTIMDNDSDIAGGDDPIEGVWRLDQQGASAGDFNGHPGPMLNRAVEEAVAQTPNALPDLTHDFDYDTDTTGATWPSVPGVFESQVGENLYDLAQRMDELGLFLQMNPSLELHAYLDYGTDRTSTTFASGKVRFAAASNIAAAIQRKVTANVRKSHLLVGGANYVYEPVADPDYSSGDIVRRAFLSMPETDNTTQLDGAGLANIAARIRKTDAWSFPLKGHGNDPTNGIYEPGPPGAGTNFWVGDTITMNTGSGVYDVTNEPYPVSAITWALFTDQAGTGDYQVIVEIGNAYYWTDGAGSQDNCCGGPGSQINLRLCPSAEPLAAPDYVRGWIAGEGGADGDASAVMDGDLLSGDGTGYFIAKVRGNGGAVWMYWDSPVELTGYTMHQGFSSEDAQYGITGSVQAGWRLWVNDNDDAAMEPAVFPSASWVEIENAESSASAGDSIHSVSAGGAHRWYMWRSSVPDTPGDLQIDWVVREIEIDGGSNPLNGTETCAARGDHTHDHNDLAGRSGIDDHPASSISEAVDGDVQTAINNLRSDVGSGAPDDVNYLVGTASASLSNEIVVGTTPGGELGGTWGSPTIDSTHSGSAHSDFIAKAIADAKGDIIAATSADTVARVPVGTDGQRLVADSTQAAGVKWADPSAATEADVKTAGRWEHAVITGSPPDDLYADGDWLYIWVSGA